jgi:hypothetical protein
MLDRVSEDGRLADRRIDRNSSLRRARCAGRVVTEEVGAGQRNRRRRQLVQVVEPRTRAGVDDQRALRPDDGVDVATITKEIDVG